MKKCPFCAEEIQDEAIKCKHCSEFLISERPGLPPAAPPLPWYFRTSRIVLAVLCVGPLALPLIWLHPKLSGVLKTCYTIILLALGWLMVDLTLKSMAAMRQAYELLDSFQL